MANKNKFEDVQKMLEPFEYKLIEYIDRKKLKIICKCGKERTNELSRLLKGQKCRECLKISVFVPVDTEKEKWIKYHDRWISSLGNVKGINGQNIKTDKSENRVRFSSPELGNHQYLARTMAIIFKIKDYEKLKKDDGETDMSYEVSYIDDDPNNIILENLFVRAKEDRKNQIKPFQTERSQQFLQITEKELEDIEYKQLAEFPDYKFFKNGIIWNGKRAVGGTVKTHGYVSCQFKCNQEREDEKENIVIYKDFSHHRLICMAFHPIEGKTKYDDYKDLQVNHKDGDKQNNSADNLEWCTQSKNQLHAMSLSTTTKGNSVSCYDCKTDEKLNTFKTVADAGRYLYGVRYGEFDRQNATEDDVKKWKKKCLCCESHIRSVAKGKIKELKEFNWKYEDEEKTEENVKKYGKK
jgi:hypothetical protein